LVLVNKELIEHLQAHCSGERPALAIGQSLANLFTSNHVSDQTLLITLCRGVRTHLQTYVRPEYTPLDVRQDVLGHYIQQLAFALQEV
jgi:hypothetical protein